jgi:hypothetical protein
MRRIVAAVTLCCALVTISACSPTPASVAPSESPTSSAPGPESAAERSQPHGTWELSPGLPDGLPTQLVLPEGRWIEERSTELDASGILIELWVESQELDVVLADLAEAGWLISEDADSPRPDGRRSYVAFNAEQTESLAIRFQPEEDARDAQLTVTFTLLSGQADPV